MLGRIPGSTCGCRLGEEIGLESPLRTPGPLGCNDAADPNVSSEIGDTPGVLGGSDYAGLCSVSYVSTLSGASSSSETAAPEAALDLDQLRAQIIKHEGRGKPGHPGEVYQDSMGHPTVGIGFNLDRSDAPVRIEGLGLDYHLVRSGTQKLQERHIQQLFEQDLRQAILDARGLVHDFDQLPEVKRRVVVNMVFNLGANGFSKFRKLIEALEARDFVRAVAEMKNSVWFRQVGQRALDLIAMMEQQESPSTEPAPARKVIEAVRKRGRFPFSRRRP